MTFLGKITEKCLLICGVSSQQIKFIKCAEAEWDIVEATPEKGENLLTLTQYLDDDPIRTHVIRHLTDQQVVILKRCSEFEKREQNTSEEKRPSLFPSGKINDWMGLEIVPSWHGMIKEYRKAADILSESYFSAPTPFLYICRHTLELQLKTILFLDQEINGDSVTRNKKPNHKLDALWIKASPIAKLKKQQLKLVDEVIDGYHGVDLGSPSLRYPSDTNNKQIKHQKYLQSFSKSLHTEKFQKASDILNSVIFSMEIEKIYLILSSNHLPK